MGLELWKICLLLKIIELFCKFKVKSQNIPSIACPNLFQYQNSGNQFFGKIILTNMPLSTIKVEAEFSQQEPILTNFSGNLTPFENMQTTQANLEKQHLIAYRVDFPNSNILPKLTNIKVNDQVVCYDNGYGAPSIKFKVYYTYYPARTAFSQTIQTNNNNMNNFNPTQIYKNNLNNNNNNIRITQVPQQNQQNQFPTNSGTNNNCGKVGSGLAPFIVGGNDFKRGQFPWLTAIFVRSPTNLAFRCGGSLISTRTVITAAHCFADAYIPVEQVIVELGRHSLYSSELGVEQREIQQIITHPEYNSNYRADADISLLLMKIAVSYTQLIRPVCLWTQSTSFFYQYGYTIGWGTDNTGVSYTPVPKMVQVNIISQDECLRNDNIRDLITPRSLCAGKRDGTGPCFGDSGGGLIIKNGDNWILRGIVSGGLYSHVNNVRVCNTNVYAAYCDTAKHIQWIQQNMI